MGSGYKDFSPGAVFTAAEVDGYLMRQAVMCFADSGTRDSALSGVLATGMQAYLTGTNTLTYYNGSAWKTANMPWTTIAGTLSQSSAVSHTDVISRYKIHDGDVVTYKFRFDCTGAGSGGSAVTVNLPYSSAALTGSINGVGAIYDASTTTRYVCNITGSGTTAAVFGADGVFTGSWGSTPSLALASSDIIIGTFSYEL